MRHIDSQPEATLQLIDRAVLQVDFIGRKERRRLSLRSVTLSFCLSWERMTLRFELKFVSDGFQALTQLFQPLVLPPGSYA